MLRFSKTKVPKEEFYGANKPIKIWNVIVDNIVISKLLQTKNISKYLIEYLDKVIRPLVLILPKISRYVKTFKDRGENKNENNKLMFLCIDGGKLLEKYKTIWIKIEDLKYVELDALPFYKSRYIKTKIRTYGNKVFTNFLCLNMPEDGVECESFLVISIDSLLVHAKEILPTSKFRQLCS